MRSIYRTMLAAVAVLALSAVVASAASAHEFIVAGSPLTKTQEATGNGGSAEMVWSITGTKVRFECKSTTVTASLETGGKSLGEVKISECKLPEYKNCSMPSVSYKVEGGLGGTKGALTEEISSPSKGKGLFELEIKNANEHSCALNGKYPVEGTYACALPGVETEALEHEVACKPEGSSLTISGKPFTLSYSNKLSLKSGQKWSAI